MSANNPIIKIKTVPVSENNIYSTVVSKDEGPVLIIPEGYKGNLLPSDD